MTVGDGNAFLKKLVASLVKRHPHWQIEIALPIRWEGQPRDYWPRADAVISMTGRRFIIEYDEDSDPGRSLVKYWPVLDESSRPPTTIIEIWQQGRSVGAGFAALARWMGERLMKLYPSTIYEFIERTDQPAESIADRISEIILGKTPL